MCPRRDKANANTRPNSSKREERETRQQEKQIREKKTYLRKDENAGAFNTQLRAFNLQLRNIVGDGNCLFRSFADQMDGDQHRHARYRQQICEYMRANREDFEPFIVDQPFDAFVHSLSKDGTFGGNECLVAFSRLFDAKICIHQLNQPVWIVCFSEPPKHEIHISYHNYEHYSSVRKLGDLTLTSANVRQAMTTCNPTVLNDKKKTTTNENGHGACAFDPPELFSEHDVEYICAQLENPVDRQLIRDILTDSRGDIDGTIAHFMALDASPVSLPIISQESIERIMTITGINDVELIEQSYKHHNLDVESTVEALLKLTTDDKVTETISEEDVLEKEEYVSEKEEDVKSKTTSKPKSRPASGRQVKADKKKAKKQRAIEKHRAQIIATTAKAESKPMEKKAEVAANAQQENVPPANMEFISI
ncbi:unnamed protein product [Adineta ricciae]|uniref:OTU domain-containing protein n=1 Tax=Adineta ricciae TaxID=249248 RepID=A0A813XWP2_ADIRI|nr:unnamed protein product [Adineta ricciae]CAF1051282.1 unnamed protein product [Adineta ricciae]